MNNMINLGAKGIVVGPIDSAAISRALANAAQKNVKVVAVDVAPTQGNVAMVVRADNHAYGEKACKYIGEHVKSGKVVQIMGDLASVNGRDRSEAFRACLKNYPNLSLLEIPAAWKGDVAASALDSLLTANPDVKAIYMQAGGVYLSPTLQTLRRKQLLFPAGDAKHIVIVSNDGIPQEFEAIRKGEIDATISQPADLYAKYGLYYIKAALEGKTFKPGKTDHDSNIVQLQGGILEDQLPAPLVTKQNVDDKNLWGNTVK
jgi:ribose transport system substrate-binding protein